MQIAADVLHEAGLRGQPEELVAGDGDEEVDDRRGRVGSPHAGGELEGLLHALHQRGVEAVAGGAEDQDAHGRDEAAGVHPLHVAGRGPFREQQARYQEHRAAGNEDGVGEHVHLRQHVRRHEAQRVADADGEADGPGGAEVLSDLLNIHCAAHGAAEQVAPELHDEEGVDGRLGLAAKGHLHQEPPAAHTRLHAPQLGLGRRRGERPGHEVSRVNGAADEEDDHGNGCQPREGEGIRHGKQAGADDGGKGGHGAVPDA
mmetsp:Transcript_48468/g.140384  ORF Transcript_48468/g.140384 Transcript_48468/m.140384 type:complete len:259 (+) Transcript_48468:597-1373(+)